MTEDVLSALEPEMYEQYKEIVEEYKKAAWGIFDEDFSINRKRSLQMLIAGMRGMCRAMWRHLKTSIATENGNFQKCGWAATCSNAEK